MRDAIFARKKGKIFNKVKLIMKVGGTCDIKLHDRDLKERKGMGKEWPRTMVK